MKQSTDVFEEEVPRFVMLKVGKHVTGHGRSDVVSLLKGMAVSWKLERVQERQLTLLVFAPLND